MMRFAIAVLLPVLVLTAAVDANAQGSSNEIVTTRRPDRADAAALQACRGEMRALGSSAKVGDLQPLLKTSIKVGGGRGHAWAVKPVRAKDLRIYAARVEKGGYLGQQTYDH